VPDKIFKMRITIVVIQSGVKKNGMSGNSAPYVYYVQLKPYNEDHRFTAFLMPVIDINLQI
jgi:hypothetical protein